MMKILKIGKPGDYVVEFTPKEAMRLVITLLTAINHEKRPIHAGSVSNSKPSRWIRFEITEDDKPADAKDVT